MASRRRAVRKKAVMICGELGVVRLNPREMSSHVAARRGALAAYGSEEESIRHMTMEEVHMVWKEACC